MKSIHLALVCAYLSFAHLSIISSEGTGWLSDFSNLNSDDAALRVCCDVIVTDTTVCDPQRVSSKLDLLMMCGSDGITTVTTITDSGNYCLGGNITAAGPVVTIAADNVTLNMNNFVINHSTGVGIQANGYQGITIKNGELNGSTSDAASRGISLTSCQNVSLAQMTIKNSFYGIQLTDCDSVAVTRTSFIGTAIFGDSGLFATGTNLLAVNGITSRGYGTGLFVGDSGSGVSSNIGVKECMVSGATNTGIVLDGVNLAVLDGCMIVSNSLVGLAVDTAQDVYVRNTSCMMNGKGATVENSQRVVLQKVNFNTSVATHGLQVVSVNDCLVDHCNANTNIGTGYVVDSTSTGALNFFSCLALSNVSNGFSIAGSNVVTQRCDAYTNTGVGFTRGVSSAVNEYYENISCRNTGGNWAVGPIATPIRSPANARENQNVDCTLTTPDSVEVTDSKVSVLIPEMQPIQSKVDLLLTFTTVPTWPH